MKSSPEGINLDVEPILPTPENQSDPGLYNSIVELFNQQKNALDIQRHIAVSIDVARITHLANYQVLNLIDTNSEFLHFQYAVKKEFIAEIKFHELTPMKTRHNITATIKNYLGSLVLSRATESEDKIKSSLHENHKKSFDELQSLCYSFQLILRRQSTIIDLITTKFVISALQDLNDALFEKRTALFVDNPAIYQHKALEYLQNELTNLLNQNTFNPPMFRALIEVFANNNYNLIMPYGNSIFTFLLLKEHFQAVKVALEMPSTNISIEYNSSNDQPPKIKYLTEIIAKYGKKFDSPHSLNKEFKITYQRFKNNLIAERLKLLSAISLNFTHDTSLKVYKLIQTLDQSHIEKDLQLLMRHSFNPLAALPARIEDFVPNSIGYILSQPRIIIMVILFEHYNLGAQFINFGNDNEAFDCIKALEALVKYILKPIIRIQQDMLQAIEVCGFKIDDPENDTCHSKIKQMIAFKNSEYKLYLNANVPNDEQNLDYFDFIAKIPPLNENLSLIFKLETRTNNIFSKVESFIEAGTLDFLHRELKLSISENSQRIDAVTKYSKLLQNKCIKASKLANNCLFNQLNNESQAKSLLPDTDESENPSKKRRVTFSV